MNCYTVKIYVSSPCEGERDAVVEMNSPNASSVACYHIAPEGTVVQVPDVRLTTVMEDAARQVLLGVLQLDKPARQWRSTAGRAEPRTRAA